jgi:hypothetical protein
MKRLLYIFLFLTLAIFSSIYSKNSDKSWHAKWITSFLAQDKTNSWIVFRKQFNLNRISEPALARIAVDSKYWLWLNEKLVVFEGQLKRGPTPSDTYYDELDLTRYLKEGKNSIAILVWYWGKNGFSHLSSGRAGLIFELYKNEKLVVSSDKSWQARVHPAYYHNSVGQQPNYRLPESNVCFDARKDILGWISSDFQASGWRASDVVGEGEIPPWNNLTKRPIPLWKNFGLTSYPKRSEFPYISEGNPVICRLPYNAHITPYFKIDAEAGQKIEIKTDNYWVGTVPSLRAEYITKNGIQEYESYGWINGHEVHYLFPKGIKILDLKFRESGFDTEFSGRFACNDKFYNQLWEKSRRTLYVTMRDTYMDCPDRERAQWWGDAVNELGEAFYALCPKSFSLAKKGILELMNWQRLDSTIFSPVPAGNYDRELPMQMLNSVGFYGFWTYYLHASDLETIEIVYPRVKKYLSLWQLNEVGLVIPRAGGWTWGDWGQNKDMDILFNCWYYLAIKGFKNMSEVLDNQKNVRWCNDRMEAVEAAFNKKFWTGTEYRSPVYDGQTDDRANALAVVSGLAEPEYYPAIQKVLNTQFHASPYLEKYVLEALYQMGNAEQALQRMKYRFKEMVESPLTTLWENWTLPEKGKGGGTNNHAWSGGPLTLLSQYAAGISPIEAGYKMFQIKPQLGGLTDVEAVVSSVAGNIRTKIQILDQAVHMLTVVPENSSAKIHLPKMGLKFQQVSVNDQVVWKQAKKYDQENIKFLKENHEYLIFQVKSGEYRFSAK